MPPSALLALAGPTIGFDVDAPFETWGQLLIAFVVVSLVTILWKYLPDRSQRHPELALLVLTFLLYAFLGFLAVADTVSATGSGAGITTGLLRDLFGVLFTALLAWLSTAASAVGLWHGFERVFAARVP